MKLSRCLCLYVCPPQLTFELLTKRNLVCISRHLSPSQRRNSQILLISNTNTEASKISEVKP
jgi:hypothetical protein